MSKIKEIEIITWFKKENILFGIVILKEKRDLDLIQIKSELVKLNLKSIEIQFYSFTNSALEIENIIQI